MAVEGPRFKAAWSLGATAAETEIRKTRAFDPEMHFTFSCSKFWACRKKYSSEMFICAPALLQQTCKIVNISVKGRRASAAKPTEMHYGQSLSSPKECFWTGAPDLPSTSPASRVAFSSPFISTAQHHPWEKERKSRKIKALHVCNILLVPSICYAPMNHWEISPLLRTATFLWLASANKHPLSVIHSVWMSFSSSFTNQPLLLESKGEEGEGRRRILQCFCHPFYTLPSVFCVSGDIENLRVLSQLCLEAFPVERAGSKQ